MSGAFWQWQLTLGRTREDGNQRPGGALPKAGNQAVLSWIDRLQQPAGQGVPPQPTGECHLLPSRKLRAADTTGRGRLQGWGEEVAAVSADLVSQQGPRQHLQGPAEQKSSGKRSPSARPK